MQRIQKDEYTVNSKEEAFNQKIVVKYCDTVGLPIVHIPNEGKRSYAMASELQAMGMRAGFPDLFMPKASGKYHGLFIEMKSRKGKLTDKQSEWLARLSLNGYAVKVAHSSTEAIKAIEKYIKLNEEVIK